MADGLVTPVCLAVIGACWALILLLTCTRHACMPLDVGMSLVEFASAWLRQCCGCWGRVHHVRIIGPRCCGKSSIVRRFVTKAPVVDAPKPTEGIEVAVGRTAASGATFVLYDAENAFDQDLASAKIVSGSKATELRYADALIFVIDGSDVGRLPLTFKILRDVADHYYKVDTLLIFVTKPYTETAAQQLPSASAGIRTMPSIARWMSPKRDLSKSQDPSPSVTKMLDTPLLRSTVSEHSDQHGVTLKQVSQLMTFPSLLQKQWKAFYCSITTGEGIEEGFEWLHATLCTSE